MSTSLEEPTAPPAAPARAPAPPPPTALHNVLGLAFGVAVTVGGCVGVGILVQPGLIAHHLPHPALYLGAWLLGGLYVLLGAVAVAELAAMTPRSGGFYVYVRRALGEQAGFVAGWAHWLALCSGAGFVLIALARYLTGLFPGAAGHETAVAVCTVVGLSLLQWRSVRGAGRVQEVTTLLKGAAFAALVVALVLLGGRPADAGPAREAASGVALAGLVIAFQAILQTYDGWEAPIYFGEEIRAPGRNLPRALFVGAAAVLAMYLCVNLALLYVLPLGEIAGHEMAIRAAADRAFGPAGGQVVFALATASILVACYAGNMQTPRVLHALSRDGLFFAGAARVNAGGTPAVALALTTAAIVLFLLAYGSLERLLGVLGFFLVTGYALMFVALFVLRWREPGAARPYRAWGHPWTTGLALAGSLLYLGVSAWRDPTGDSLWAAALLAASVPVFALVRREGARPCSPPASGSTSSAG